MLLEGTIDTRRDHGWLVGFASSCLGLGGPATLWSVGQQSRPTPLQQQ